MQRFSLACRFVLILAAALGVNANLVGCQWIRKVVPHYSSRLAPVEILRSQNGSAAALTEADVRLVNSSQDLEAIGSEELAELAVDFESESLVVVALGEKPTGGYWVEIDALSVRGDELYIHGVANRPDLLVEAIQVVTHPYAAAVIGKQHADVLHPEIDSVEGQERPASEVTEP